MLGRHGVAIENVLDTLTASLQLRRKRPRHNLAEVSARDLGVEMDRSDQTSDLSRRPLRAWQLGCSALDAGFWCICSVYLYWIWVSRPNRF